MSEISVLQMPRPVTVLAFVTFAEDQPMALAEYLRVTTPLLDRAGARIMKRFTVSERVVGSAPAQSVMIVEYPSRAAVAQVFNSAEYHAVIPVRDRAFLTYHISIASE